MAHHFTFSFVGVGHQVIRVRIDLMSGPPSSHECVCVDARRGPPHFLHIQTCCASAFFGGDGDWKGEGRVGRGALNSTGPPLLGVWVEFWHSIFCLFCFARPPPTTTSTPTHIHCLSSSPSPSFCVSVGWWVCLFVWIQSDTASPPAYRHTDSEITSQWQRLKGGRGGREGGREERQMYRQSLSGGGMGISHTSIIGYVPWSQLFVV